MRHRSYSFVRMIGFALVVLNPTLVLADTGDSPAQVFVMGSSWATPSFGVAAEEMFARQFASWVTDGDGVGEVPNCSCLSGQADSETCGDNSVPCIRASDCPTGTNTMADGTPYSVAYPRSCRFTGGRGRCRYGGFEPSNRCDLGRGGGAMYRANITKAFIGTVEGGPVNGQLKVMIDKINAAATEGDDLRAVIFSAGVNDFIIAGHPSPCSDTTIINRWKNGITKILADL